MKAFLLSILDKFLTPERLKKGLIWVTRKLSTFSQKARLKRLSGRLTTYADQLESDSCEQSSSAQ